MKKKNVMDKKMRKSFNRSIIGILKVLNARPIIGNTKIFTGHGTPLAIFNLYHCISVRCHDCNNFFFAFNIQ